MSKTGILILTNPARVKNLLPVIKNHVLKTLYIQYTPEKLNKPQYPIKPQINSTIITNIYALATSFLSRIDVRLLIQNPSKIITKRPVELVIFDKNCSPDDAKLFINNFLMNKANNCGFISLDVDFSDEKSDKNDQKVVKNDEKTPKNQEKGLEISQNKLFNNVVLGGTFDRLHNGHKILLTEAVVHCRSKLTVGVTDESMIQSKILWELIEPCSRRIEAVGDFLEDIDSSISYSIVPISDMYGPTKDEDDLDLIVVSEETKRGGEKVNELRKQKGLRTLEVFTVGLADDSGHHEHEEVKISSSNERIRLLGKRLKVPDVQGKTLKPYIVGLTGGIASGKSSVAEKLSSLGAGVVHCDKLAHQLYEPGEKGFQRVIEVFGRGILDAEGRIDRGKLGNIVFHDKEQLDKLNKAVWPAILEEALAQIKKLHSEGYDIIVMEAAVLIQAKWQSVCHEIWTCIIPHEEAVKRMMERNGLSKTEAEARINVQPSNVEQVSAATVVFSTLWSHQVTLEQVNRAWEGVNEFLKEKLGN